MKKKLKSLQEAQEAAAQEDPLGGESAAAHRAADEGAGQHITNMIAKNRFYTSFIIYK